MKQSLLRRGAALAACVGVSAGVALSAAGPAHAEVPPFANARITTDEYRIPGGAGRLYLREKRLGNKQRFTGDKIVLFLEPFGVPTADAFDVPGYSWMDERARAGFDAWALDFRNFGRSDRDAAMSQPIVKPATGTSPALTTTAEAMADVETAIAFIRSQRGGGAIDLVGWSWGGVVAGAYAAAHPGDVAKLVLDASMHAFVGGDMVQTNTVTPLLKPADGSYGGPNYQCVGFAGTTFGHWKMQAGGDVSLIHASADTINSVGSVFTASDPLSATGSLTCGKGLIRRAMGPMTELVDIWRNKATYDATKVKAPVLAVRGDHDFFAEPGLAQIFSGASTRKDVVIPGATHWALYETNGDVLIDSVADFLGR